jgi:hypothetical protein
MVMECKIFIGMDFYADILLNTTIMPSTLLMNIIHPFEANNLTQGVHLVMTLRVFLSLMMVLISVLGILTIKMIEREVLDRSQYNNKKFMGCSHSRIFI